MARRIIVHIGPAKTGTSSLQEALFASRADLQGQGFEFPAFGRHRFMQKLPGHHGIPADIRRLGEMPGDVLAGLAGLDPAQTVVFSSEDFSLMDETAVAQFVEQIGPAEIEVIYYARRWDHLLPSIWQELIKHGHSWPYLEFLNGQVSAPRASHYLNYALPLERWVKALGRDSLRIFSYDNVLAQGEDIVSHFCTTVLGVAPLGEAPRRNNPRWPAERVEILRVLNRLCFGRDKPDASLRMRMVNAGDTIAQEMTELERMLRPFIGKARPCAPLVARHLEKPFLRDFGSRLENPVEGGGLFANTPFDLAEYVKTDYLAETDAVARLRALSIQLEPPQSARA